MAKLSIVILTAAALAYAVYLTLFRTDVPDPRRFTGWRKRFIFATLLFTGLLQAAWNTPKPPQVLCYDMPVATRPTTSTQPTTTQSAAATLQAVWRTLDAKRDAEFREMLETAVARGDIRRSAADILIVAFAELADHKRHRKVTCYSMPAGFHTVVTTRERAFAQIELLAKARQRGQIDPDTAAKACHTLARELEMLHRMKPKAASADPKNADTLIRQYKDNQLTPTPETETAARLIVEMESR